MRPTRWRLTVIDKLLAEFANTDKSLQSIMYAKGYTYTDYNCFLQFLRRKSAMWKRYQTAREAKTRKMESNLAHTAPAELDARGDKWFHKRLRFIDRMKPLAEREAQARQHRAEQAVRDPRGELLRQARERLKRPIETKRPPVSPAPAVGEAKAVDMTPGRATGNERKRINEHVL